MKKPSNSKVIIIPQTPQNKQDEVSQENASVGAQQTAQGASPTMHAPAQQQAPKQAEAAKEEEK